MTKIERLAAIAVAALLPTAALAHPGFHPDDLSFDIVHVFTEPDHLLTMAAIALWLAAAGGVLHWFEPWRAESWRSESRRR